MNILLVSQCEKRALTETRRILDQFAERRGERVWQTPITQAGLDMLRKLLRKTARKNTAVACHWIRGRDHSELLWIVGDASRFNDGGAVPTDTTSRDILRDEDENYWHTLEDIRLLAQMAALLHDLGKANDEFQQRLKAKNPPQTASLYRHEWVSLRLFQAFVGKDDDKGWLQRFASGDFKIEDCQLVGRFFRDGLNTDAQENAPFASLPPLASAIGWLIVSHHRLPTIPVFDEHKKQAWLGQRGRAFNSEKLVSLFPGIKHDWNARKQEDSDNSTHRYWHFKSGLPTSLHWQKETAKIATRLLTLYEKRGQPAWLDNPYVMHLARLTLMLADHHYSSLKPAPKTTNEKTPHETPLYANTYKGGLNQKLDAHLLGVAKDVASINHALPAFTRHLPHLARHRGLKARTTKKPFLWQNKATDAAEGLRAQAAEQGAFIINMASTGCGKTLANARIMNALSDPQQGLRCAFALGLRTLTLQTGESYRRNLHLDDDTLAILVGGSANRHLFEYYQQQAEASGSESIQALIEEDSQVLYEGHMASDGLLSKIMKNDPHPFAQRLLSAPVLVCTIDHLTPATEAQRGGRQMAPMLRLMSSDLVLDELDDFGLDDLPALTRLVHWAGLLGTRILISSATLPPALVEGMYLAYREGRRHYRRNRGEQGGSENAPNIPCLWIDEFHAEASTCADLETFQKQHQIFVRRRVEKLAKHIEENPCRRGELLPLNITDPKKIRCDFAGHVLKAMLHAHQAHHEICPKSRKRVSFGLVRMANIEPLFDVALNLFEQGTQGKGIPENFRIHLCVYHSRFPLLLRSAIEHRLDETLNRHNPDAVYALPEIRRAIDGSPEENHLFVVLGSPVTEVGRDHDYDWAVVEPSSMRSLIQLAGRVQRHRQKPCPEDKPNIFIFDTNLRHFNPERSTEDHFPFAAFIYPGFEYNASRACHPFRLTTHRLGKLLREDEYRTISARPRIQPRDPLQAKAKESLVDLEHARLLDMMMPKQNELPATCEQESGLNAASVWQTPQAMLTWALPQQQPFRANSGPREVDLVFLPDEDETRLLPYRIVQPERGKKEDIYVLNEVSVKKIDLPNESDACIVPWGQYDLLTLLREFAQAQESKLSLCDHAKRLTVVSVLDNTFGWRYHPALGFAKQTD